MKGWRRFNNFFPTPEMLARKLIGRVPIYPGDHILEPSAGMGDIARVIREMHPGNKLTVMEIEPDLCRELAMRGFSGVQGDFLKHQRTYDVIIGNPPFRNDFQDIDHFLHAWKLLRPRGRIAMILHEYSAFPKWGFGKPARFRAFLERIGAGFEMNPAGSFMTSERPTPVSTCMVWASVPPVRQEARRDAALEVL